MGRQRKAARNGHCTRKSNSQADGSQEGWFHKLASLSGAAAVILNNRAMISLTVDGGRSGVRG